MPGYVRPGARPSRYADSRKVQIQQQMPFTVTALAPMSESTASR
eukprot:CAMPEP_0114175198 /NCGR_PEP_ID=MMETSP0043_2-20121206/36831_1 /TAXON_ID=464988 /ORGANISM="Hemiselmis andersenii, Strain CCMP644" /LENGTH=43 /DNA_ID= /DNA_START= /DNA_END= /DNA_ORIENTATION=